jgi:hypothetical protein
LYLLKHVETDDSIFSISPVVHSSNIWSRRALYKRLYR